MFCLAEKKDMRRVLVGGGNIGLRLARILESRHKAKYQVKVVDVARKRCEYLSQELSHALVLAGDATDSDLLADENVSAMGFFTALTNDDEDNFMASLLAKKMGARRVIALINRRAYGESMEGG